jgi:ABC-type amino acid transport substrate-binding protein
MGKIFAALFAGLLIAAAAAAEPTPLRVGIAADHPPLAYVAEGKIVGMEADFARLLETQLQRPLQLQVLPAADLLPALARGQLDMVMSGLVITPQREKLVDFTVPYLQVGQMAIIRTDDVMKFRNPASLSQGGFRVGFVAGSAGADYVAADMTAATAVPCASAKAGLQALLDRRIDVLIDDAATSWSIATEPRYGALMSLYRPLTEEFLAWAVGKNNPQLQEQLNDALLTVKPLPVFEHILNRWIPVRIAAD